MDGTDESERSIRLRRRNISSDGVNGNSIDSQLRKFGYLEPGMNQTEKEDLLKVLHMSTLEQGGLSHEDDTRSHQDKSGPSNGRAISPDGESLDTASHNFDTTLDVNVVPESPLMDIMNEEEPEDQERMVATNSSVMYADVVEKLLQAAKTEPRCKIVNMDPWIRPGLRPEEPALVRKNWTIRQQGHSGRRRYASRSLATWLERLTHSYRQRRLAQPQPYPPEWGKPIQVGRTMPGTIDAFHQLPVRQFRLPDGDRDQSDDSTANKEDDFESIEPPPVNKPLVSTDDDLPDLASPSATIVHSDSSEELFEKEPEVLSLTPSGRPIMSSLERPIRSSTLPNVSVSRDHVAKASNRLRPTTSCTKLRLATQPSSSQSCATTNTWFSAKTSITPPQPSNKKAKSKFKQQVVGDEDIPEIEDFFDSNSKLSALYGDRSGVKVVTNRKGLHHAMGEADRIRPRLSDPAADGDLALGVKFGSAVKTYSSRGRAPRKRDVYRLSLTDRPKPRSQSPSEEQSEIPGPSKRLRTTFTGSLAEGGAPAAIPNANIFSDDDDEDNQFGPEIPSSSRVPKRDKCNLVQCPLCNNMFPAEKVEAHADACKVDDDDNEPRTVPSGRTSPNMKRCYVCRNFYQEKDYATHVFNCIAAREQADVDQNAGIVASASVTPKRVNEGNHKLPQFGKSLLGRLTANDVGGSTGNSVLNTVREGCLKRKYDRMRQEAQGGPSTPVVLQDKNISINHVALSPLETFVPISKQTNSLIDYKNQFSYSNKPIRIKTGAKKSKRKRRKRCKRKRSS